MRIFRTLGLGLACALALASSLSYADSIPFEAKQAYAYSLNFTYDTLHVCAVNSERQDVLALKSLPERTSATALTVHEGFLTASSGAVQASTQYASLGVLHARHAA